MLDQVLPHHLLSYKRGRASDLFLGRFRSRSRSHNGLAMGLEQAACQPPNRLVVLSLHALGQSSDVTRAVASTVSYIAKRSGTSMRIAHVTISSSIL